MTSKDEARDRADTIRTALNALNGHLIDMAKMIARTYELADWRVLGYDSWKTYCEKEYGSHLAKLNSEVRHVWSPVLRDAGMDTGAIATVTGVNRKTIQRDRKPRGSSRVDQIKHHDAEAEEARFDAEEAELRAATNVAPDLWQTALAALTVAMDSDEEPDIDTWKLLVPLTREVRDRLTGISPVSKQARPQQQHSPAAAPVSR